MRVTLSTAQRLLIAGLISWALVACSSDGAPSTSPKTSQPTEASSEHIDGPGALDDLASAASERANAMPNLLLIVNKTRQVAVLTSADGKNTATLEPGKSVQLASKRVCGWLPLTASTTKGRVIDEYVQPCRGQTWTITD